MVVIAAKVLWPKINSTIPGSLVGLVLATAIASYFHLNVMILV